MKIELMFTEELLGSTSANPDLVREFIASKRPEGLDENEIESLPPIAEELQKGTTVFPRDGEKPIMWDYQVKGFFKDACSMLKRVPDTHSSKQKAHKKLIDGLIFILPRKIPLLLPEWQELGICERPLRGQTAQGERISLARSETAPVGTKIIFEIKMLAPDLDALLEEWLDYGALRGLGQWRNSGKGRFSYQILDGQ